MELLTNFLLTTGIIITLIILLLLIRINVKTLPQYLLISIFVLFFFVSIYSYGEFNDIKPIYSISFIKNTGHGVKPDIEIIPSIEELLNGKDMAMDYIMRKIRKR